MAQGHPEYDAKGMPFRLLGSSGLRVPLFSLGGCEAISGFLDDLGRDSSCAIGLTFGGSVKGDPVKVRAFVVPSGLVQVVTINLDCIVGNHQDGVG